MAMRAITYCDKRNLLPDLLLAIKKVRPEKYADFEDHLFGTGAEAPQAAYTPPPLPDPDQVPEPGILLAHWRLPFGRNALFTGRTEWLLALGKALLHGGAASTLITQAIQGMGGIGKTQLAVEFAYRYGRFFHGVHWLNCAVPEAINAEIAACGEKMRLGRWPQELPEQVARTLEAWAQDGHCHLVILENLEEIKAGGEWLRQLRPSGAALLITSRERRWPRYLGLAALAIQLFTVEESRTFLRRYLSEARATQADVDRLAEKLGHLPLALELAGCYLDNAQTLSVATFLENLEAVLDHPAMEDWIAGLDNPTGYERGLVQSFALSWGRVEDEAACRLFRVAGYCAPNQPIPCELLESALDLDEEACAVALGQLTGLGLLDLADPAAGPTIHPLLAEFARTLPVPGTGEEAFSPLPSLAAALAPLVTEANESGLPARFVPLRPHLEATAPAAEAASLDEAGRLWNSLGYHLKDVADYAGARAALERALAIDEAAFGPDHPNVATIVNNLGLVLKDLGDLAGARAAFERALAIWTKAYGDGHPQVATATNNLGGVLQALGDLAGARAAYERALAIFEKQLGADHPNVATLVNNLGMVLQALGDLAGARAAYERALAIRECAFGRRHPDTALTLWWLGTISRKTEDLESARSYLEEALDIYEAFLPVQHPDVQQLREEVQAIRRQLGQDG